MTPVAAPEKRSIPACAGEPVSAATCVSTEEVYPRVCGGTRLLYLIWPGAGGLSPRVRGNPRPFRHRTDAARSIPACAGEPATHTKGI